MDVKKKAPFPAIPLRSLLFVPANRRSWIEKVPGYTADAVILDLEDSVPPREKDAAREVVRYSVGWLADRGVRVFVRINKGPQGYSGPDLAACAVPGLVGVVLPKPDGPEDVEAAAAMLDAIEARTPGAPRATLIPTLETARSLQFAYECARQERVIAMFGAIAKDADLARSVGFRWSPGGLETLYLRSRVVLAARAAGKLPLGGLWQQVHDLEGLRSSAKINRSIGMAGEMILHPGNAEIINEVYSPSPEELTYYAGMIAAYEAAIAEGRASTMFEGDHIDSAHVETARAIVALDRT